MVPATRVRNGIELEKLATLSIARFWLKVEAHLANCVDGADLVFRVEEDNTSTGIQQLNDGTGIDSACQQLQLIALSNMQ